MGRVDLAVLQEGRFRRLFAVKRLHEQLRSDRSFREMFMEEARLAGLIHHPNVVSVIDVGEDEQGPFLVMDYIEGVTVRRLINNVHRGGAIIPIQICCAIAAAAARGLQAAHQLIGHDGRPLALVHRDVSPQNILVGFDGIVRVTDFGIAKALGSVSQTATGMLKGKLGYMAPEVLQFEKPDQRSDLYSLGVVLFEMLTGARLFPHSRDEADRAKSILTSPTPDIEETRDDVPPELHELLLQLMAKSPHLRPPGAENVAKRLMSVIEEQLRAQGLINLEEYVNDILGHQRAATQERIRLALDEIEEVTTPDLPAALRRDAPLPKPRRPVWRARLALALLGSLVIGGVSIALWASSGDRPSSERDTTAPEQALEDRGRDATLQPKALLDDARHREELASSGDTGDAGQDADHETPARENERPRGLEKSEGRLKKTSRQKRSHRKEGLRPWRWNED